MTTNDDMSSQERTVGAMHDTAQQLEVAEAILHHGADASPNAETKARLHGLGDEVTLQARSIDRRADRLAEGTPGAKRSGPVDRAHRP
ncbi:hypothetical protein [Micromonospora sp. NPDC049679]|uniref:hypothetical protein n=1 Tax=Micromonospora sp. NPDC049679 TaxID=3155920 RepID=UPI0033DD9828